MSKFQTVKLKAQELLSTNSNLSNTDVFLVIEELESGIKFNHIAEMEALNNLRWLLKGLAFAEAINYDDYDELETFILKQFSECEEITIIDALKTVVKVNKPTVVFQSMEQLKKCKE